MPYLSALAYNAKMLRQLIFYIFFSMLYGKITFYNRCFSLIMKCFKMSACNKLACLTQQDISALVKSPGAILSGWLSGPTRVGSCLGYHSTLRIQKFVDLNIC